MTRVNDTRRETPPPFPAEVPFSMNPDPLVPPEFMPRPQDGASTESLRRTARPTGAELAAMPDPEFTQFIRDHRWDRRPTDEEVARRLLALVRESREAAGLPPLERESGGAIVWLLAALIVAAAFVAGWLLRGGG